MNILLINTLLLFCQAVEYQKFQGPSLKEIDIFKAKESIIDTFDQFGVILNTSLLMKGNQSIQPCFLVNQQLVAKSVPNSLIDIIPSYSEAEFREFFDNGHFSGKIPEILSMVQITDGSILLTNQGLLIHLKLQDGQFKIHNQTTIDYDKALLKKPVFMEYLQSANQLIIILHGFTIGIEIKQEEENIFGYPRKIYETFDSSSIKSVANVQSYLFVAVEGKGVVILESKEQRLQQISWEMDQNNVQDLKVFNQYDIYFIFVIDNTHGLKQFIYNQRTTLFNENLKLGLIPYPGTIIDIHKDILMIVQPQDYDSIIIEIKIDYQSNSWKLVNKHRIQRDIQDIDISDTYAIILGKNGHEIIYHSLPKDVNQTVKSTIIIPSLQKMDLLKKQHILSGVSRHKYFYTQLYLQSPQIVCYTDQEVDSIEFTYEQNSTKCPRSTSSAICQYSQAYRINIKKPWITAEAIPYIYVITVVIVLGFIILIVFLIREFRRYQTFMYNSMPENSMEINQPKSNELTINAFDSPNKFNKLSSHSRIPQLQLRD